MFHSLLIQQFRFSDSHIQMFPALLGNQNNHSLTPRPHLRLLEALFPDFSTTHLPTLHANLKSKMMRRWAVCLPANQKQTGNKSIWFYVSWSRISWKSHTGKQTFKPAFWHFVLLQNKALFYNIEALQRKIFSFSPAILMELFTNSISDTNQIHILTPLETFRVKGAELKVTATLNFCKALSL